MTARKRSETLLDVPVAITAITAAQLGQAGTTDLTKIADMIPQVVIARGTSGGGGTIAIRGIASSGQDPGLESSVSISVDGIQITRGWITQTAFFDVAQIEVLKGPQALFFGKNSPAGVISLRSEGPTATWQSTIRGGYEFVADERFVEATVSGPITDTLGVRLAGRYSKMTGWLYNDAQPANTPFEPTYFSLGSQGMHRTPNGETFLGRATVEWQASDRLSASLKFTASHYTDSDITGTQQVVHCGSTRPATLGLDDPYDNCRADNRRSNGLAPDNIRATNPAALKLKPYTEINSYLGSFKLDYELGDLTLTSLTGLYDLYVNGYGTFDFSTYARIPSVVGEKTRQFSQELRVLSSFDGPINFAAGAYYEDGSRTTFNVARLATGTNPLAQPVLDPTTGYSIVYYADNRLENKTYSGFGQLIVGLASNLELAGGVRFTRENRDAIIQNAFTNQGVTPAGTRPGAAYRPAGSPLLGSLSDDDWSPEATLTWHPVDDMTIYGGYRSGYKSGGFSATGVLTATQTIGQLTFQPESSEGFEVGYKARLADRKLTLSANAYRYSFSNLQRSSLDIATTSFVIRNAATAIIKGAEIETSYRPLPNLTFNAALAYNKARYSAFPGAACYNGQSAAQGCVPIAGTTARAQDLSNTPVARAPEWAWNAGFQWNTPLGNGLRLGISSDVRYSGSYLTQDDGDPAGFQEDYIKVNGALRLFDENERWELGLIGRNLGNEYVVLASSGKVAGRAGDLTGTIDRPREVLLQGIVRF